MGRLGARAGLMAAGALAIGATLGYAAIPDEGGVIHACYKDNGDLRVIDPSKGDTCKQNEVALDWNEKGVNGDTGPQGLKGDKGDVGATGPQGERGLQGEAGPTGLQGTQGETGATGSAGPAGPQGQKGDAGPTGPAGPAGAQGPPGQVSSGLLAVREEGAVRRLGLFDSGSATAECPAGWVATGGGFRIFGERLFLPVITSSRPGDGESWSVSGVTGLFDGEIWAVVICATVS